MSSMLKLVVSVRGALASAGVCILLAGAFLPITSRVQAQELSASPTRDDASAISKLPEVQRLGDDTTAYVFRMGWEELKPQLAGTQALEAIEDPQIQAFFKAFKAASERPHPASPFFKFLLAALHDQLVMVTRPIPGGQTQPSEEEEEQGRTAKPSTQNFAIVTPGPQGKAQFGELYGKAIEALKEAAEAEAEKATIGSVTFDVLEKTGTGLHTAWNNERCYWAVGAGAARWAAESSAPPRLLARSERFQASVGPLFKGQQRQPIALYYYDLRPWWRKVDSMDQQGMWKQVSWHSLDAVAGATFIEKDHYRNRHYWRIGPERYGLFKSSGTARINEAWIKRVPADCSGFTTGVYDAYSLMAFLPTIFMRLFGAEENTIMQAPMFMMPFQPILKELGPRYLIYRMPGRYGSFPIADVFPLSNAVVISEVRDAAAFKRVLQTFAMGPVQPHTSTVLGRTVVSINVMYFTIYFAVLDNEVLISMHPQLLKDAIEAAERPGPSVMETAAYKEAVRDIPPNACFLLYMPPGGFSRGLYDHYIPMLQQAMALASAFRGFDSGQKPASTLDPIVFPRGSDIARHARQATILTAVDDGQGVLFDGTAPILATPYYWAYVHALNRLIPMEGEYPPLMLAIVPFIGVPE